MTLEFRNMKPVTGHRTPDPGLRTPNPDHRSPAFLCLLAVLVLVAAAGLLGVDRLVAQAVRDHLPKNGSIHRVADGISLIGGIGIYPLAALALLIWAWWIRPHRGLWRACLWMLTAEAACSLLVRVLKIGLGRWRPGQELAGQFEFFQGRIFNAKCHSFPSGHTADAAAVAAVLWFVYPRLRPLYVAWVVVMAASRVCAQQHFVADTATGAALGILCALVVGRKLDVLERWIAPHRPKNGES